MHLRIPNTPLTIVGDPCQASSVPFSGHVEVACKPSQQADISSIRIALVRTTKIKKAATKTPESLLASRRRSFGSHSPTRDKRTSVEELLQWTIAYSPSPITTQPNTSARPGLIRRSSSDKNTVLVPFHIHIPGHLPAAASTPLGSTSYALTATALSASAGTPLLKTETPLPLQRALHLPHGPAAVVLRRRFPESLLSTRLTVPGVLRPADAFTAQLTLSGSVTRRGRTSTHLALRRLDWRIEERTSVVAAGPASSAANAPPPPFSEVEAGTATAVAAAAAAAAPPHGENDAAQQHVRKLAAGKWEGGGWTGSLDKLPAPAADGGDVELGFEVALPASAKALCGVDPRFAPPTTAEPGGEHASLAVSHVLVLELITVELRYKAGTGELVNMYPFPQRKFGAVYDVSVANWDYDGGSAGRGGMPALALPPCGEVLGERPPSYDSVAVM